MAKVIFTLLSAALISVGIGVGAAVFVRAPSLVAVTAVGPAEILHGGETDQVLRLLAGDTDLNAMETLDRPVGEWPAGATIALIEALVTQDNDNLLLFALALQPHVDRQSWQRALCVAASKGKGSLLPVVLERLEPVPDGGICAGGDRPSTLAEAANHIGAAEELRDAGF